MCDTGKSFRIKGKKFFEIVGDELYPMNADIYHKEAGKYYTGYKNDKGRYTVYEKDGLLGLSADEGAGHGKPLYRVDIYEDISGKYFPKLEEKNAVYMERGDGKIELIKFTKEGSRGEIVDNYRSNLLKGGVP